MKTIYFLLFLIIVLSGCENNANKPAPIALIEVVPGGCAIDNADSMKSSLFDEKDTLSYSIIGNNLQILVGFNATCCGTYTTSANLNNDTIIMDIKTAEPGMCYCICFYTYSFIFSAISGKQAYKVYIDNNLTFTGLIEP